MKVAFLATDMVEQIELTVPWDAVKGEGWEPQLVSLRPGTIQGANHHDKGDPFPVDRTLDEVDAGEYDALVVPGGVANPDEMRTHPDAVSFVRDFFEQGKPVAVICHGPWMLVEADVVRGRRLTSWPSLPSRPIPQRGWRVGRRAGGGRQGPRHEPQTGRPGCVLQQAGGGVPRGTSRGTSRGDGRTTDRLKRVPDARRMLWLELSVLEGLSTAVRLRQAG